MSDSIKKYYEMQEETEQVTTTKTSVPDDSTRSQAYRLLTEYDENVIRYANWILDQTK